MKENKKHFIGSFISSLGEFFKINKKHFIVTFISSLGASFEMFDYIIFLHLHDYFAVLFFPDADSKVSILKTIMLLIVARCGRIISGTIFGYISDKYGRKPTMLFSVVLMSISTFSIALLPTHAQLGVIAPLMLLFLRLLQGIAYAVEIPTASTYLTEYSKNKKGLRIGLMFASTTMGSILAQLAMYIMTYNYTTEQIIETGVWRYLFIIGGFAVVLAYFIRNHLPETLKKNNSNNGIKYSDLFQKENIIILIKGLLMMSFLGLMMIHNLYLPSILNKFYGFSRANTYYNMICSMLLSMVISPLIGIIIDKYCIKKISKIFTISFVIIFPIINYILLQLGVDFLLLYLLIYQIFLTLSNNFFICFLSRVLPEKYRNTMFSFIYHGGFFIAYQVHIGITEMTTSIFYTTIVLILVSIYSSIFIHTEKIKD